MNYLKKLTAVSLILAAIIFTGCSNEPGTMEQQNNASVPTIESQKQSVKSIPVEALVLKKRALEQKVMLTGSVQAIHSVDIVSEVSGKVKSIRKELGSKVTPADTLAVIDDKIPHSQYRQALSQVISMENNLSIAQLNLKSDRELFKNNDISQLAYENSVLAVKTAEANLLSAKANLSLMEKSYLDTRITSPISGLIARDYLELGMMVNPNMPLYHIVDLTKLKVSVGVPQDLIQNIRVGTSAKITISALGSEHFKGEVKFISPQADASTGAFNTEIHFDNTPSLSIRAGMTSRVELLLDELGRQLAIPDYAHIAQNGDNAVYKIDNGFARLVNIKLGQTYGSNLVVTEGLSEGDTIVVVGMKNLGTNTKVWIETTH